jgi:hypothetical protein
VTVRARSHNPILPHPNTRSHETPSLSIGPLDAVRTSLLVHISDLFQRRPGLLGLEIAEAPRAVLVAAPVFRHLADEAVEYGPAFVEFSWELVGVRHVDLVVGDAGAWLEEAEAEAVGDVRVVDEGDVGGYDGVGAVKELEGIGHDEGAAGLDVDEGGAVVDDDHVRGYEGRCGRDGVRVFVLWITFFGFG